MKVSTVFIAAFLFGIILGHLLPITASIWGIAFIAIWLIASEIIGAWGFGGHWREYRWSSHFMYTGPVVLIYLGALIGSKRFGYFFTWIGQLLS